MRGLLLSMISELERPQQDECDRLVDVGCDWWPVMTEMRAASLTHQVITA